MSCDEIDDLLPGVALGAGTREELQEVEGHLATCDRHPHWEEFKHVVETLPMAIEPVAPGPRVKRQIMARVYRDLEPRSAARRPWRWAAGWIAAAAMALVALGLGIREQAMSSQLASAPVQWQLQPAAGVQARGTLVWLPVQKTATLTLEQLPALPASRVYEVWLIKDGRPAPAGIFEPETDNSASVIVKGNAPAYDTVAVTEEQAPSGAQAPTSQPLLSASLK